jgi:large subunit ribosomal protein L28
MVHPAALTSVSSRGGWAQDLVPRRRVSTLGRLPGARRVIDDCCDRPIGPFDNFRQVVFGVAAVCDVCGKGPGFGMSVSHSHRRTHRRWNPNIQPVRAQVAPGTVRKVNVCTSCLKAGKVVRG